MGDVANAALSGAALVHRRVFSYAEYELTVSGSAPLLGSITKENGRRERGVTSGTSVGMASGTGVLSLRPLASPISGLVDRSFCSEFQVLSAIGCDLQGACSGSS